MSEAASGPLPKPRPSVGGLGRLLRLTRKELSETLRDRRTFLTLVLMPVLLYLPLGLGYRTLFRLRPPAGEGPSYRLGFPSEQEAQPLLMDLDYGRKVLVKARALQDGEGDLPLAIPQAHFEPYAIEDVDRAVLGGLVDIAIRPRPGGNPEADYELVYAEESVVGPEAARYVRRLLEAANTDVLVKKVNELKRVIERVGPRLLPERPRQLSLTATPLSKPGTRKTPPFLVLVPLVLILMTITGAVYPAIDLTAGERERGTLEALMAAPVPRMSLLLAKYVAVLVVAMLTGLVNLGAMMVSISLSGDQLATQLLGEQGMSPLVLAEIFFLMLMFTSFFAALLLALSSLARSFKEAQAYLVPLMVVALIPGMFSLVPGIQLVGVVPFVPLLNIVVLARDIFAGTARMGDTVVVVSMTLIYTLAAISLAAALFGRDVMMAGPAGPRWGVAAKGQP